MERLYEQGVENGVHLEQISMEEAREIDPLVTGYGNKVLWSPSTSILSKDIYPLRISQVRFK